jgi:ATP-dependent helicase/nuclease subunit B
MRCGTRWGRRGSRRKRAAPFGREDALTHPQYHLKLLLNRMGVARGEVEPGTAPGRRRPPERSRAISNLFLPPAASARWVDLPERQRRLRRAPDGKRASRRGGAGHRHPDARGAGKPEKRVALVTPDRGLAGRVVAHLRRWGIMANDTAGLPLPQTAAGRWRCCWPRWRAKARRRCR